jgi:hypothetical protein
MFCNRKESKPALKRLDVLETLFYDPERLSRMLTGQQWAMDRRRRERDSARSQGFDKIEADSTACQTNFRIV